MNLNRHICTQLVEKANGFAQITVDDDYIVRDNKPDVVRIIYSKGDIYLEDTKVGNQVVWITGKLRFSTLYLSDDENHRLESVTGEIPFQEKLVMDEVTDGDEVSVDVQIEDLSVGIINSRKLVVRAILDISVISTEEEVDTFCRSLDAEEYEGKTNEVTMLCLIDNKKDLIRMQKEMILPNSRSNIGELIFYQVDFRNEEILLQNGSILVQMDAQIWVLYRSESTGEYESFETVIPMSGEMSSDAIQGDEIFWATVKPLEVELEARGDYDGESRMLGMDVVMSMEVQIYREESCEILQDAYALDRELILHRESVPFSQLLVKNLSKIRLMEQAQIEPNEKRILQICGSSGHITIDRVEKGENGIHVEGILNVHVLYNTTDDVMPFAHVSNQIPFEQTIEIDGFTQDAKIWLDKKIEQIQVNLLDNSEYEIKAAIQLGVMALQQNHILNIVDVEEKPLDMDALQRQPGMIGCIRKEGEDLWDIAKKYHATAGNIIEIGNRVLVVKQVL